MAVLGDSAEPGYSYHGYGGASFPNQEAETLVAPQRIRVNSVGLWVAGWSGTCRTTACVWDASGVLLSQSAEFVAANGGDAGPGNALNYVVALPAPVIIDNGATFYVGFNRHRDDAHQVSTGNTSNPHYHGRGAYAGSNLGAIESYASQPRRIGCYVADYQPAGAAWVYRSGVWTLAEAVKVYRTGVWVDVDSLQVRRGAAWVDSE